MLDYSAALEYQNEVRAFGIVESDEYDWQRGDGGQAFGLLQMHPATFSRYYQTVGRFAMANNDTWATAEIKACAFFLDAHKWNSIPVVNQELVVQCWNLGEAAVYIDGKRNPEYLAKWQAAYAKITSGTDLSA